MEILRVMVTAGEWTDHTEHEIELCDVSDSKLTENIISENMLSQVDSEGRHFQLLK